MALFKRDDTSSSDTTRTDGRRDGATSAGTPRDTHPTNHDTGHDTRHDASHDTRTAPAAGAATATREPHDRAERAALARENARERFGGINWGASFFGWLVAVAVAVLLTSILGAIATGVGYSGQITQSEAEREANTIGLAAGITLVVVLALAYFTGGYVAGRMSRFDGARQGLGAWIVGLIVTVLAVVVGAVAGSQYNILDRVDLPRIPLPSQDMTLAGVIVAVALILLTVISAMLGGKIGTRYHHRVDRAHTV